MNTRTNHRLHDVFGACAGIAGLVLLIAAVAAAGPIGLSIGAVIGGSFAFGVLACALKEVATRRSLKRRALVRDTRAAGVIVTAPLFADATASEFVAAAQPSFAPVTSLTEVQVLRQRAAHRRAQQRTTLSGA